MINKHQFKIDKNKKILHKIGKKWVTISAVTLALLGGATFAKSLITKADVTQPTVTETSGSQQKPNANTDGQTASNPKNIQHQANRMLSHLMLNSAQQKVAPTSGAKPAADVNNGGSNNSKKTPVAIIHTPKQGLGASSNQPTYNLFLEYVDLSYHTSYTESDADPLDPSNYEQAELDELYSSSANPMDNGAAVTFVPNLTSRELNQYLASHIKSVGDQYSNFILRNPDGSYVSNKEGKPIVELIAHSDYILDTPNYPWYIDRYGHHIPYFLAYTFGYSPYSDNYEDPLYYSSQRAGMHTDNQLFGLAKQNALTPSGEGATFTVKVFVYKPYYLYIDYINAANNKLLYHDRHNILGSMQVNPPSTPIHTDWRLVVTMLHTRPELQGYKFVQPSNKKYHIDGMTNLLDYHRMEWRSFNAQPYTYNNDTVDIYLYQPGYDKVRYVDADNNDSLLKSFSDNGDLGVSDTKLNSQYLQNNVPTGYTPTQQGQQVINSGTKYTYNKDTITIPVYQKKYSITVKYVNENNPSQSLANDKVTNAIGGTNYSLSIPTSLQGYAYDKTLSGNGIDKYNQSDKGNQTIVLGYVPAQRSYSETANDRVNYLSLGNNQSISSASNQQPIHYSRIDNYNENTHNYTVGQWTPDQSFGSVSYQPYLKSGNNYYHEVRANTSLPTYSQITSALNSDLAKGIRSDNYTNNIYYDLDKIQNVTQSASAVETTYYQWKNGASIVSATSSSVAYGYSRSASYDVNTHKNVTNYSNWQLENSNSTRAKATSLSGYHYVNTSGSLPEQSTIISSLKPNQTNRYAKYNYYEPNPHKKSVGPSNPILPSASSAQPVKSSSASQPSSKAASTSNSSVQVSNDMKPAYRRSKSEHSIHVVQKEIKHLINTNLHGMNNHQIKHYKRLLNKWVPRKQTQSLYSRTGQRSNKRMSYRHSVKLSRRQSRVSSVRLKRHHNELPKTNEPVVHTSLVGVIFAIVAGIIDSFGKGIDDKRKRN